MYFFLSVHIVIEFTCLLKRRMNYHGMTTWDRTAQIRTNEPNITVAIYITFMILIFILVGGYCTLLRSTSWDKLGLLIK